MAYSRRSGGGGGGYNGGSGGYSGGAGRFNSGGGTGSGYRPGVNPWQSGPGGGGPAVGARQGPQQYSMPSGSGGYGSRGNWGVVSGGPPPQRIMGSSMRSGPPGGYGKRPPSRFSGGNRKSGKDSEKRKSTSNVKSNNENNNANNKKGNERTKEQMDADKKESYAGVPSAVLYCHVCSKHMWDSESFEKHVRGRPHELMITYLDEAYKMKVDLMRHQIKAVENQRQIDLERVTNHTKNKSGGKSGSNSNKPLLRSYCPMCDVRFYGPLTGHRKSDRHRKLKQFLHPECKLCDALFHTRLEMDEHKLTAGHLKKVAKARKDEFPELKDDEFDLVDMIKIEIEEQLDDHDQMPVAKKYEMLGDRDAVKVKLEMEGGTGKEIKNKPQPEKVENEQDKSESVAPTTEEETTATNEEIITSNAEKEEDEANANEDGKVDAQDASSVAVYDPNVAIGKELLVPSTGYICRLCACYLQDLNGVALHCQTAAHYINYTTMTKMKDATSSSKKRSIDEVKEESQNEGIDEIKPEENVDETEEQASKRIKLDTEEETEKMETSILESDTAAEAAIDSNIVQAMEVQKSEEEIPKQEEIEVKEEEEEEEEEAAAIQPPQVAQQPTPTKGGRGGRGGGRGRGGGVARRGRR
ncbi:zinc finger protein on ecdysone puffs-like isoform X2 [Daktulosphaira vitifoliae]|uniref:zinc finger protein on ecdysone puffs-like isoform X2 n=1 Tax=Daktulosphaira vitifoliae TaxID=58002 RepID=UPI0021AA05B6|nr:zinc finger protein on ecdysone puffs-like isoform X2 [Daktulosphaira vitifoliae]